MPNVRIVRHYTMPVEVRPTYVNRYPIPIGGYIHRIMLEPANPEVFASVHIGWELIVHATPLTSRLRAIYPKLDLRSLHFWQGHVCELELRNTSFTDTYKGIYQLRMSIWETRIS